MSCCCSDVTTLGLISGPLLCGLLCCRNLPYPQMWLQVSGSLVQCPLLQARSLDWYLAIQRLSWNSVRQLVGIRPEHPRVLGVCDIQLLQQDSVGLLGAWVPVMHLW